MAGTIFGMGLLPADFVATRLPRAKAARGRLTTAVLAVMCAATLISPPTVGADTPCRLWRFDGYTQFDFPDGGKMTFITWGRLIDFNAKIEVWAIPPSGGKPTLSHIWGGIGFDGLSWGDGNALWMERFMSNGSRQVFNGGVADDGFAYGIAFNADQSTSWRTAVPLRCADNGG